MGAGQNPPVLRAPNSVVANGLKYWGNGVIPWKAEEMKVSVLLPKLTGAPYKPYVEIGEGTHTIIMEKNRMNLFREVQLFLDEKHAPAR